MQRSTTFCVDRIVNPLTNNDEYQFVRLIGRGSFGCVVEALDRETRERVAIKFLPRGERLDVVRVKREILNHRVLNHHHVIRFIKLILTPTALGIVMEFATGGNLREYVRRRGGLGRTLTRFLFQQLVLGIDYCHRMKVVNRDISLQNTLVTGNMEWPLLKICDFGFSKHAFADSKPNSVVGTRQTMAPEVIGLCKGETYDGEKADIWCIGVFLYVLTTNRYPFCSRGEEVSEAELVRRIYFVEYKIPSWVPKDCTDLIRRILVRDPGQRPTIEEIKAHPYFTKNLPEGALEMNKVLIRQRVRQSIEEMEALLARASKSLAGPGPSRLL